MAQPWEAARSFDELKSHLPPDAPQLQKRLGEIVFQLPLPNGARAMLAAQAKEHRLTVDSFFDARTLHSALSRYVRHSELVGAFKVWLRREGAPAIDAEGLTAPLRAALLATGLPDCEQIRAADVEAGESGLPFGYGLVRAHVRQIPHIVSRWISLLEKLGKRLASARAAEKLAPPLLSGPGMDGDAPLARLRRAAAIMRQPHLSIWPRGVFEVDCRFVVEGRNVVCLLQRIGSFDSAIARVAFGELGGWLR